MSYARIVNKVFLSPWAIEHSMLGSIISILHSRLADDQQAVHTALAETEDPSLAGLPRLAHQLNAYSRGQRAQAGVQMQRWGTDRWGDTVNFTKLAHEAGLKAYTAGGSYMQAYEAQLAAAPDGQVVHIFGSGILGKHLDSMEEMCAGGLSIDRIQAALRDARDDEKVAAVVLQLDSPGGLVPAGMSETHAIIDQIRTTKTIVQFCDSRTASAAVWLTAATDHTYITPGGEIGSIGVYAALVDCSLQLKQLGVNIELVTDGGTHKGAGAFNLPLTPEQKARVKDEVMYCSDLFKGYMRTRRKGITDETLQGQMFIGQQAIDAKLADSLVNSLEEVIADLATPAKA